MVIIRARAPLRLGLGGGGTDLPEFYEKFGGKTLSAAIDLYAHATVEPLEYPAVEIEASDLEKSDRFELVPRLEPSGSLDLHKGVYNRIVSDFNKGEPLACRLMTYSDVPAGSGLGSSSAMVVTMVKAFVEWLNLPLDEYEIASLAYDIERKDLGLSGGKQDQYSAAFGGINFIEFVPNGSVIVNPLRVKNWIVCELETSLVLFHTGVSRQSAEIIDEQARNILNSESGSIDGMISLRDSAVEMKSALLKGRIKDFAVAMQRSWESKKATAHSISNPFLDEVFETALRAGALAGKVSGAGGGGFMMFLVDSSKRTSVARALEKLDGTVRPCHLTDRGVEGWRVNAPNRLSP